MGFKSRKGTAESLTMTCGLAHDFRSQVVSVKDLVGKVTPNAKLRIRLSLEQGTMGAPYAKVEVEEA